MKGTLEVNFGSYDEEHKYFLNDTITKDGLEYKSTLDLSNVLNKLDGKNIEITIKVINEEKQ